MKGRCHGPQKFDSFYFDLIPTPPHHNRTGPPITVARSRLQPPFTPRPRQWLRQKEILHLMLSLVQKPPHRGDPFLLHSFAPEMIDFGRQDQERYVTLPELGK